MQRALVLTVRHVQVLIAIPPTYAVSHVGDYIKAKSAIPFARMFRERNRTTVGSRQSERQLTGRVGLRREPASSLMSSTRLIAYRRILLAKPHQASILGLCKSGFLVHAYECTHGFPRSWWARETDPERLISIHAEGQRLTSCAPVPCGRNRVKRAPRSTVAGECRASGGAGTLACAAGSISAA